MLSYFEHQQITVVTYFYDQSFRGYALSYMIPKNIQKKLKPEDYQELPCPCKCGKTHTVVTKERIEEVIKTLDEERVVLLN